MSELLLCISGRIGAGKTALCARLAGEYCVPVVGFGDVIRAEMATALHMTRDRIHVEARRLMQEWGNFRRSQDPDYWTRLVVIASGAARRNGPQRGVIVDSLRARAEAETFRALGYKHIHLAIDDDRRFEYLTAIRGMDEAAANDVMFDPSEHLLNGADDLIDLLVPVVGDDDTYEQVSQYLDGLR